MPHEWQQIAEDGAWKIPVEWCKRCGAVRFDDDVQTLMIPEKGKGVCE